MATRRTRRLGNLIQAELAEMLVRRVKDPRVRDVSLTGVDVSPDLSQAKVFYSVLDGDRRAEAQAGLEAAAAFMRRELAQRLHLKVVPRLLPTYDPSLATGARMERIIREARQADAAAAKARGDDPEGEEPS